MEIGNLRRHDDESKENVKQAERLCSKRTILHVPHPFFTALRRERTRINFRELTSPWKDTQGLPEDSDGGKNVS